MKEVNTFSRITSRVARLAEEAWLPVVAVVAWWMLSASSQSMFLPPLRVIVERTWQLWIFEHLRTDLAPSLVNLGLGYSIAIVVGVLAGMALAATPRLLDAIEPELEFLRAIPAVALIPVAIILIGLGNDMRVSIIAFGSVWPILLNTIAGGRSVEPVVRDMAEAFQLSGWSRLWRVRLPAAAPQILAGARSGLSIAVVLVVVSEIAGARQGIGFFVLTAQRNFAITDMWTGMIVLGVVGYLLNLGFRWIEARLLHWHPTYRLRGARDA